MANEEKNTVGILYTCLFQTGIVPSSKVYVQLTLMVRRRNLPQSMKLMKSGKQRGRTDWRREALEEEMLSDLFEGTKKSCCQSDQHLDCFND